MKSRAGKVEKKVAYSLLIAGVCVFILFPVYWLINTSLQAKSTIYAAPPTLIPPLSHLTNYVDIFKETMLALWLGNSLFLSASVALISIGMGGLGAYSLSRFQYPGKGILMLILLLSQMLPEIIIAIPLYVSFKHLNLLNKVMCLVITNCSFCIPISTFFLKGFFDSIPREIEEAAVIDGCNRMQIFYRIFLPLSLPGLIATGGLIFVLAWNEFLFARTFLSSGTKWVTSVGVASFIGQYVTPWNKVMAGAVISVLPVMLVFIFFQKYLVRGLTSGAVKG